MANKAKIQQQIRDCLAISHDSFENDKRFEGLLLLSKLTPDGDFPSTPEAFFQFLCDNLRTDATTDLEKLEVLLTYLNVLPETQIKKIINQPKALEELKVALFIVGSSRVPRKNLSEFLAISLTISLALGWEWLFLQKDSLAILQQTLQNQKEKLSPTSLYELIIQHCGIEIDMGYREIILAKDTNKPFPQDIVSLVILCNEILEKCFNFTLSVLERMENGDMSCALSDTIALRIYELVKKVCELTESYFQHCQKKFKKKGIKLAQEDERVLKAATSLMIAYLEESDDSKYSNVLLELQEFLEDSMNLTDL